MPPIDSPPTSAADRLREAASFNLESSRSPLPSAGFQIMATAETYSTVGRSLRQASLNAWEEYG
jgi:hypothetical protein